MSALVGNAPGQTHLVSQEHAVGFPHPILPSTLLVKDEDNIMLLEATTRRLQLRPKQDMVIANIIS